MAPKNLLITGLPGCGKSTLIERVVARLNVPATGFFTREFREAGGRVGFSIITLDGREGLLAHQKIKGRYNVGKYGVNLEDIDRIAVPAMIPSGPRDLVVIDEIGKMECFSSLFREKLVELLDSGNTLLGSIALRGNSFIEKIKKRKDVQLFRITVDNRDELVSSISEHFEKPVSSTKEGHEKNKPQKSSCSSCPSWSAND